MKTYLYLSTAIISVSLAASGNAWAQCVSTQDCTALGYTETSCPNGGVKCPFGSKWACFKSESEICNDLGFTLSCTGTEYSGGSGKACNGKYSECTCVTGYIWNDSSQKCEDATANCVIGALYYSDGTCSDKLESSKTLLGVVIYEKSASQMGWIMTVEPIRTGTEWDASYYSTGITDKAVSASCTNTQKLVALGSRFEAANAANNYSPCGTPSGKSWCLPSYNLLNKLNNSTNLDKVNDGITIAGGTKLGNVSIGEEYVWSSSEYSDETAWGFYATRNALFGMSNNIKYYNDGTVRPVLAF